MKNKDNEYTAENIQILEGLEAVRRRPAMYIGSTDVKGLHHLVYEVVDNSIDEALAGACDKIIVTINKEGSVTVLDNGRGIPVDIVPEKNITGVEVVMTILHAGGKFGGGGYSVSGGLHGVGVSVVNALSEWLKVEVYRNGKIYRQEYRRGDPVADLTADGTTDKTGTKVTFKPDPEIFETVEFNYDILQRRLKEQAYLNKGLTIILEDENTGESKTFCFEGGIISFAKDLTEGKEPVHPDPVYICKTVDNNLVEVAFIYTDTYKDFILSFANNIKTTEGGTHLTGFKSAITRSINKYARAKALLKPNDENFSGEDVREGITAVISVKLPNPQFEGQTKTKLGNSEMQGIVDSIVDEYFSMFLEENPKAGKEIVNKACKAARAREAAKRARDIIRSKPGFSNALPGKLADCSSKDPSECEIYIVEGDSAGGCFSGDTKVALADGRELTFIELAEESRRGKENFCYTIMNDGSIGIEKILYPRCTKRNSEVIKISLDNDEEIICTPDHRFMLRNGEYAEAQNLKPGVSLMPLRKKISRKEHRITIDGYEMVFNPSTHRWMFTHMIADDYNIRKGLYAVSKGTVRHHIDYDKLNNNPNNIIRLSGGEHIAIHAEQVEKTLHRPEVKEKCKQVRRTIQYREKIRQIMKKPTMRVMLSDRAKKQWQDEDYKKYMTEKFLDFYQSDESYRKTNNERLDRLQKEYWSLESNRKKQSDRVKEYFEKYPEKREHLSQLSKEQWKDESLKNWRRDKTKEQWTEEFRVRRKEAYNRTYFNNTIVLMKKVLDEEGNLDRFNEIRRNAPKCKNILLLETFIERFFNGNIIAAEEAVKCYNHKVKKVERLSEKIDVYDIEVPDTHNFALASGVFVHNSAKQGRDRHFQAVLPLRGKILNIEKARIDRIMENEEIKSMFTAIGVGMKLSAENGDKSDFDLEKLRYDRVIIMTDADVDGSHIRTLLLTFFYRHMPQLLENGNIYIAQPPLYKVSKKKQFVYAYNDEELNNAVNKFKDGYTIQRYKGLGEMNADQLWETTMNPETRIIQQVSIEDAEDAEEIFSILMGNQVQPRKEFIQRYAKKVKNLDI